MNTPSLRRVALATTAIAMTGAAADRALWADIDKAAIPMRGQRVIQPVKYRTVRLDRSRLAATLAAVPTESSRAAGLVMSLPMPDGSSERFSIVEAPVMEPALAAKFPSIRTYRGVGVDNPALNARLDYTPAGFHAMIRGGGDSVFIDPYQHRATERDEYIIYNRRDYRSQREPFSCGFDQVNESASHLAHTPVAAKRNGDASRVPSGDVLRSYVLAVATTGEYTSFHGGTVADGLAAVVTAINRVTGIYETEVAIRFLLTANNDQLIFTDAATDPYSNFDGFTMLFQNQSTVNSIIGSGNYDIGHVFSTGGGGIASQGVVCRNNSKAQGVTGLSSPIGDPFYVDFVSHEIGHQFDATHTFNGTAGSCGGGNRTGSTAYEPGSGSTIMAYSGICASHNIQSESDPYFHAASYDQIVNYSASSTGDTCDTAANTGNSAPVVDAGAGGFTIPVGTPFELTGSATDPEFNPLTYSWEQFDLGPGGSPLSPTGNAPMFRSFPATVSPTRVFPKLESVLTGVVQIGEVIPTYSRSLTFRLTARDNQALGGGVDFDTVSIDVTDTAGPFEVTSPAGAVSWDAGSTQFISWAVNGTDQPPVNCATVDVSLSLDGGFTYPETLLSGETNGGFGIVTVPNTPTTQARLRIDCNENIFFNVSPVDFTIVGVVEDTDEDGVADDADNCVTFANPGQEDSNGDGLGNECDADLTNDCSVNFADLAALKAVFFPLPYDADADLNSDGFVNFADLARMKQTFFNGATPGPGPSGIPNDCD